MPPFAGATWHEGELSEPDFLPHFSNQTMGEMLLETVPTMPDLHVTVVCGHTHSSGFYAPNEQIRVHTGAAEYGHPEVAGIVDAAPQSLRVGRLR